MSLCHRQDAPMSQPIVFISRHRVKPGKLEELTALTREILSTMEAEKPRTLMNLAYVNKQGTEVTFMQDPMRWPCTGRALTSGPRWPISTSNRRVSRSMGFTRRADRRGHASRGGSRWGDADAGPRVRDGIPPAGSRVRGEVRPKARSPRAPASGLPGTPCSVWEASSPSSEK